jgi:hypothetical protein
MHCGRNAYVFVKQGKRPVAWLRLGLEEGIRFSIGFWWNVIGFWVS